MEGHPTHWRIVKDSISGERAVDEQTFASLTILTERLAQLKKLDKSFDGVAFSPDVRRLTRQNSAVAIG